MEDILNIKGIRRLFLPTEDVHEFPLSEFILRWVNFHLKKKSNVVRVTKLDTDYSDSVVLAILLHSIFGSQIPVAEILTEQNLSRRAQLLISRLAKVPNYSGTLLATDQILDNDLEAILEFFVTLMFHHPSIVEENESSTEINEVKEILSFPRAEKFFQEEWAKLGVPSRDPEEQRSRFDPSKRYRRCFLIQRRASTSREMDSLKNERAKLWNLMRLNRRKFSSITKLIKDEQEKLKRLSSGSDSVIELKPEDIRDIHSETMAQMELVLRGSVNTLSSFHNVAKRVECTSLNLNSEKLVAFDNLNRKLQKIAMAEVEPEARLLRVFTDLFSEWRVTLSENQTAELSRILSPLRFTRFDSISLYANSFSKVLDSIMSVLQDAPECYSNSGHSIKDIRRYSRMVLDLYIYSNMLKYYVANTVVETSPKESMVQWKDVFDVLDGAFAFVDNKEFSVVLGELLSGRIDPDGCFKDSKKQAMSDMVMYVLGMYVDTTDRERIDKMLVEIKEGSPGDEAVSKFQEAFSAGKRYMGRYLRDDAIEFLYPFFFSRNSLNELAERVQDFGETLGIIIPLLEYAVAIDTYKTLSAGTLFRSNDLCTKTLSRFFFLHGHSYLQKVVGDPIREIIESGLSIDVNEELFTNDPEGYTENLNRLKERFSSMIQTIFKRVDLLPRPIRIILHYARKEISKHFPDSVYSGVGGFVFLRFICPAIATPFAFGLIPEPFPRSLRGGIFKLSSLVQSLSNGVVFGRDSEYLQPLNAAIEEFFPLRKKFFDDITDISEFDPESYVRPFHEMYSGMADDGSLAANAKVLMFPTRLASFNTGGVLDGWRQLFPTDTEGTDATSVFGFRRPESLLAMCDGISRVNSKLESAGKEIAEYISSFTDIERRVKEKMVQLQKLEVAEKFMNERVDEQLAELDPDEVCVYRWNTEILEYFFITDLDEFLAFNPSGPCSYLRVDASGTKEKEKKYYAHFFRGYVGLFSKRIKSTHVSFFRDNYKELQMLKKDPKKLVETPWPGDILQRVISIRKRSGGWKKISVDRNNVIIEDEVQDVLGFEKKSEAQRWHDTFLAYMQREDPGRE